MILSSHIIVASAAAASAVQAFNSKSPFLIFSVALASHYLLDIIPHWEYELFSIDGFKDKENDFSKIRMAFDIKNLLNDFLKLSFDFFAGLAAAWFLTKIFWPEFSFLYLTIAAGASVLPDVLQGFYIVSPPPPEADAPQAQKADQPLAEKGAMKKIFFPLYIFHLFFHSEFRLEKYPLPGFLFQMFIVGLIVALLTFF